MSGDHHHGHDHDDLTAAQDRAIARAAFDGGDPQHGALHVARAIAEEPLHADGLALLERLAGLGISLDTLFPLDGEPSYGEVAARAWLEHRAGLHEESISLLCQVIAVRPDLPFHEWLQAWTSVEAAVPALQSDQVSMMLSRAIEGARKADEHDACSALADIAATIRRRQPANAVLAGLHCRALRGAGRTAEAVSVCEAEDARAPTYMSAVFLAGSRRDHGDLDGALAAYGAAWSREGRHAGILLDVGDVRLAQRNFDAAIAAYEEALAHGEGEQWAPASIAYCKWLRDGGKEHLHVVEARAEAGEGRAQSLVRVMRPYQGWLPNPVESVINIARQIASADITSGPMTLAITSVEAPSAVVELLATCRARFGSEPTLTMKLPDPDPRRPRRAGAAALWKYEDDFRPQPAVFAPAPELADRVARLAATRYQRATWFDAASDLVLDLDADAARDLHAVMIHPPQAPEGTPRWDWRRDVQVAAAMGLAWLPGGPVAAIERLRWLVDGQVDWTCTAALNVLAEIAQRAEKRVDAIAAIFDDVDTTPMCPVVYMCLLRPVADLALQLPDRSPEFLARWRARRAELAD